MLVRRFPCLRFKSWFVVCAMRAVFASFFCGGGEDRKPFRGARGHATPSVITIVINALCASIAPRVFPEISCFMVGYWVKFCSVVIVVVVYLCRYTVEKSFSVLQIQ